MIIENPAALQFFLTEEIYFDQNDVNATSTVDAVPQSTIQSITATEAPVETPVIPQTTVVIETPVLSFNYLGGNAKNFLIVCHYPGLDVMDDKHLTALTSALQRKELSIADVAILNLHKYIDATVDQLTQYFKPQRLLILGAQGRLAGWDVLDLNQLTDMPGHKALYTFSFAEMMGDRDKTKAFWEQMKLL